MRTMMFGCAAAIAAMAALPAPAQAQFAGPLVAVPQGGASPIASNRTSYLTRDWANPSNWRDAEGRYAWVDMFVGRIGESSAGFGNGWTAHPESWSNRWLQPREGNVPDWLRGN